MKNRIIFLDIDGVVNTRQIGIMPFPSACGKIRRKDGFFYDLCNNKDGRVSNIQAVMWLNKLCKDTGAKIVISSTWRFHDDEDFTTEDCLRNSGLLPEIEIIGKTPNAGTSIRGDDINNYLCTRCDPLNTSFVILDDDNDMGDLIDYLVLCDTDVGFGYNEYRKALEILIK